MNRILLLILLLFTAVPNTLAEEKPESKKLNYRVKSMQQMRMEGVTQQTLDYSCGAASLSILLREYFGDKTFGETALLKDIILRLSGEEMESRITDGFSMLDLRNLAIRLGYGANGVMLPKNAIYELKGPVIILLHKKDIKHFVVLKGGVDGYAYIADPMTGNYRLPEWDLNEMWKGEALILDRSGFGLPQNHGLAITAAAKQTMPTNSIRSLQPMDRINRANF